MLILKNSLIWIVQPLTQPRINRQNEVGRYPYPSRKACVPKKFALARGCFQFSIIKFKEVKKEYICPEDEDKNLQCTKDDIIRFKKI